MEKQHGQRKHTTPVVGRESFSCESQPKDFLRCLPLRDFSEFREEAVTPETQHLEARAESGEAAGRLTHTPRVLCFLLVSLQQSF